MKALFISLITLFLALTASAQPVVDYHKNALVINPLGLLQFGPMLQYEAKIGQKSYLVPHFRYSYLGFLSHALWTEFEDDAAYSPASFGVGLGYKTFLLTDNKSSAWYVGVLAEFQNDEARYAIGYTDESIQERTGVGFYGNVGHRWRSRGNFFLNVGLIAGAATDLKNEERMIDADVYGYEYVLSYQEIQLVGMLELSLGWEF